MIKSRLKRVAADDGMERWSVTGYVTSPSVSIPGGWNVDGFKDLGTILLPPDDERDGDTIPNVLRRDGYLEGIGDIIVKFITDDYAEVVEFSRDRPLFYLTREE